MALAADIRKTVTDATPVLAAVGLTDLAVEKVRQARAKASEVRVEIDPASLQVKAQARVAEVTEQAQELPALALNRGLELAAKAQESYEGFAVRGEKLVKRVSTQKSTKDLIAQAEATFALGKGAVTTVRRSATDIQRSAKATLTTGRKQAAVAADAIAESVTEEAAETTATVKKSTARTRSAAKRTTTTAKKSAAASKSAAKGAATSATKTAAAATKAAEAAAEKVGD
jgi:heparin binding hemagglutinin HbhA